MSEQAFWCADCQDSCEIAASCYRGDVEVAGSDLLGEECDQCPRCTCGTRMSEHGIEPGEHFKMGRELWAPRCWIDHVGMRQELEEYRYQRGVSLRRVGVVVAMSAPVLIALALILEVIRP